MDMCLHLLISLLDKTRYSCLNIRNFTVQDLSKKFMATELLFFEYITIRQPVKKFPVFMNFEDLSARPQQSARSIHSKSPYNFSKIGINIILNLRLIFLWSP
jgi:hypothetical protein